MCHFCPSLLGPQVSILGGDSEPLLKDFAHLESLQLLEQKQEMAADSPAGLLFCGRRQNLPCRKRLSRPPSKGGYVMSG